MGSNCYKLYCRDLLGDLSVSENVTQWHPKCLLIVTICHPVTPKWPLIITNCISVISLVSSFCQKLSHRDPKGTTNCPNCHTVTRNWHLIYTNCGSVNYIVTFKSNQLSPIAPSQLTLSFHKLSAASPKEPITVTNCHSLTQQLTSNRHTLSSMFSHLNSHRHKLSPSEPRVECNCHKL